MKTFLKEHLHNYLMVILVGIGLWVGLREFKVAVNQAKAIVKQAEAAVQQIQESQKYRALDSLMRLEEKWSNPEMQKALLIIEEIVDKLPKSTGKRIEVPLEYFEGKKGKEYKLALTKVAAFFETLGYGESRNYIDFDQAYEIFGYLVVKFWDIYECAVEKIRKEYKEEGIYKWFETFAKKCQKMIVDKK